MVLDGLSEPLETADFLGHPSGRVESVDNARMEDEVGWPERVNGGQEGGDELACEDQVRGKVSCHRYMES